MERLRLTDELLNFLGIEYRKMVRKMKIEPVDAPFYLFVERYLHSLEKALN